MANTARLTLETIEAPGERFALRYPSGAVLPTEPRSSATLVNPVDLVLGALGACSAMDVIAILRKKRQDVRGYEVEVIGERRDEHPRIYTRIEIVHRVRGRDVSEAALAEAIRLSDTKYCSVHAMLEGMAVIVSRFEIVPV